MLERYIREMEEANDMDQRTCKSCTTIDFLDGL